MLQGVVYLLLALGLACAAEEKNKDVGTVVGIDLGTTYSWYVKCLVLSVPFITVLCSVHFSNFHPFFMKMFYKLS